MVPLYAEFRLGTLLYSPHMEARRYEYRVVGGPVADNKLAELLNAAARDGWEPVNAYADGGSNHYALVRRPLPN